MLAACCAVDERTALGGLRRFFVVPHTHWDREWYWPFERFRLRLARVVDELLKVLERDPAFRSFTLDGQAIVLEDYLELRPEHESRLRALIAAGRLEVGPVYVQPDEFLVGGEALIRNLLIGRAVCERFGAAPAPAAYLPDGFGHPCQLPQILAGFGIETLLFSRGLGDQLDEIGVVFNWQAPDGSAVRAFQLLPGYGNFAGVDDLTSAIARVEALADRFAPDLARAGIDDFLLCNGEDHVAVQPEVPHLCAALEQSFPGVSFRVASYADYVREVDPHKLPTWCGELVGGRLQNVLRGVNSARLYIKQVNERAERRLLEVETLWSLRCLREGGGFPVSDFALAWRELLRCHPHDSICGCSCDEVHRDMLVRYESLERTLGVLEEQALEAGEVGQDLSVGIVNPLPYRRSLVVERAGAEPALVELDGFAARTVELEPTRSPVTSQPGYPAAIESDRLRVEVAADGTLTVTDLAGGARYAQLHALEDEPDMGDLYTFCPVEGASVWRGGHPRARVIRAGPVVWELELTLGGRVPAGLDSDLRIRSDTVPLVIRTVVRIVRGSDRVEFRTIVDNAARDHRLRAVFPIASAIDTVRAEGQFAVVRRPLAAPVLTAWIEPPAPTAHMLAAVAAGELALLTRGLPEYEARPRAGAGAELCLTLLRSVGLISRPAGLPTRPVCAGPPTEAPEAQCLGRHELEYALLVRADELDDTALLRAAQDYRHRYVATAAGITLDSPLTIDGDVVFSCLTGAQDRDGVILRCFNPGATSVAARLGWSGECVRTRMDETGEQPLSNGELPLRPGEIATVRLRAGDGRSNAADR
jgi:2-O-(6-phospho-alpha-D-mannosyl)-D-glycerate hydrolase